ncbi:MAG: LCP family protein [Chloroflexota bacterium]
MNESPAASIGSGFSIKVTLATFGLAIFILGGFWFGWMGIQNIHRLRTEQPVVVYVEGGAPTFIWVPPAPQPVLPRTTTAPDQPGAATARGPDYTGPEWRGTERINVLLLGIDHRDDEPIDGSRSDTMMLVSIDPNTRSAVMASMPRDMWVNIPGLFPQRINSAHMMGGPPLAVRTVEALLNMKIHHWARVDFRGFEEMIDALGGVIIDVERPVKDDQYPTEDYGTERLYIPIGPQWMDGHLALQYARSRHSENDFGRARRQQRVLIAARDRALQLNMLAKLPSLVGTVQKAVSTDVGVADMLALARLGSQLDRDRIVTVPIDASNGMVFPFIGNDGANLLEPNRVAIQGAIQQAIRETAGVPKIEVLNGTQQAGMARRVADQLAGAGFQVVRWADADRSDYAKSVIVVLNDDDRMIRTWKNIAARFRVPEADIQITPDKSAAVDIRVIVGRDAVR